MNRLRKSIEPLLTWFEPCRTVDWVALLTALVLIRNSHDPVYLVLSLAFFGLMLASKELRRSPLLWFGIVIVWMPRLFFNWYENEDHVFFAIYWCAAIGLALWGRQQQTVLARSAKLLIGLSFAFALAWKIVSPQFYDSSLFHYKLLYDYRFREVVTSPIAGLSHSSVIRNDTAVKSLRSAGKPETVAIEYPDAVSQIAVAMTYWTILIEGLLAVLFLVPGAGMINHLRNGALLIFMVTTYLVVPVMGFASLFAVLGFAQCDAQERKTKLAYVAITGLLTVYYSVRWHVI